MNDLTEQKIVMITRKTRLDSLIAKFNTVGQAKFYVENLGSDFYSYQLEDKIYKHSVAAVENILRALGKVQRIERSYLPNFIFNDNDIVVVVGQDGLVVNILKYLNKQKVIAINPDPNRWDGILLPFNVRDTEKIIWDVMYGKHQVKEITFAEVTLNDGQSMLGVNDIFIGPKTHTSAQYIIAIGDKKEQHSSSGVIISTGLGSTGWFSSILAGARGIVKTKNTENTKISSFPWDKDFLYYTVREPFPSNRTSTELVFGKITQSKELVLTSLMPQHGVIFSDGIEEDFLEFNSGKEAIISIANKKGFLVI